MDMRIMVPLSRWMPYKIQSSWCCNVYLSSTMYNWLVGLWKLRIWTKASALSHTTFHVILSLCVKFLVWQSKRFLGTIITGTQMSKTNHRTAIIFPNKGRPSILEDSIANRMMRNTFPNSVLSISCALVSHLHVIIPCKAWNMLLALSCNLISLILYHTTLYTWQHSTRILSKHIPDISACLYLRMIQGRAQVDITSICGVWALLCISGNHDPLTILCHDLSI